MVFVGNTLVPNGNMSARQRKLCLAPCSTFVTKDYILTIRAMRHTVKNVDRIDSIAIRGRVMPHFILTQGPT